MMGCDIHMAVEAKEGDRWLVVARGVLGDRWYSLFSRVAEVRGAGPPVVEPRGLPEDLNWLEYDDIDLGDHTFTWLTTEEFKKAIQLAIMDDDSWYREAPSCYKALVAYCEELMKGYYSDVRILIGFDS